MKGEQSFDEEVITRFEQRASKFPDKTAIVFLGEKFSYAELRELIYRFANALYELGVRDNDRVMLYCPNSPQWLITYYAVQKIGGIAVPTSPIYTPFEIEYQLKDSGAKTIICQDTNFGYVREVCPGTGLETIIVTNISDMLPLWKRLIGRGFDRIPHGSVEHGNRVYFFKDLISKYPPKPPKVDINPREHLARILYTGGTIGMPKGVPCTHSGMVSSFVEIEYIVEGYVSEGDERLILVNPLFHTLGQVTCMGLGLNLGNPTVIMPVPVIDAILEAIQKYKATLFMGSPVLYRMILENDRLSQYNLSSLKYCWSGGDVLPTEVFNRFKELTGRPIYQLYGSTEAGTLGFSALNKEPSATCLGRTVPIKEYKIADPETLEAVPPGETGELMVDFEFIMDYWNKPEETAYSFKEQDGKRWYRTGDFVSMDRSGELHYVERTADVIKYKAYRVSASEIEAVLQDHEAVVGACAVGVPDHRVGERIKVMVVLKEGARGVGAAELIKWCREKLAPYKIPQYIEFRDMLPKSKVGKLLRREIREEERRKTVK